MAEDVMLELAKFIDAYLLAIEKSFESVGRSKFGLHGDRLRSAMIFKCADGIASFYLPDPPDGLVAGSESIQQGISAYDFSDCSLDAVCQTMHMHSFHISASPLGSDTRSSFLNALPLPDAPKVADLRTVMLSYAVANWITETKRAAERDGRSFEGLITLPAFAFGRPYHATENVIDAYVPGRSKIWSPLIQLPGGHFVRLFEWTHADLWWEPERLDLENADPTALAAVDLLALQVIAVSPMVMSTGGTTVEAREPGDDAASKLDRVCDDFLSLLATSGDDELKIHAWLQEKPHWIFLDQSPNSIRSKVPFGDRTSDFVIRRPDDTYLLVEIERATLSIFKADGDLRHEFNHACEQISDWQRYIRDNIRTVREELDLAGIADPMGMVVFGRSSEINTDALKRKWQDMKGNHGHLVFTYDELIDRVKALAAQLRLLPTLLRPAN